MRGEQGEVMTLQQPRQATCETWTRAAAQPVKVPNLRISEELITVN